MNTALAYALAQVAAGIIEIWRQHENRPPEWEPTAADWQRLLSRNEKTAEDYKREAREALDPLPPHVPEM